MTETEDKMKICASHRQAFQEGVKAGLPIGAGYFAVAFSLGVLAGSIGLTPLQGFLSSLLVHASAGEYAELTLIAAGASVLEVIAVSFIASCRYLLMSCAFTVRLSPRLGMRHRLLIANCVTDEIFAVTIARPGYVEPYFPYAALLVAAPMWAAGTALGIFAGNIMPARLVSALSVALYGMFLAVIVPPAKKDRVVLGVIAVSFAASLAFTFLPYISTLSGGTRTIILTVVISAIVSVLFPHHEEDQPEESDPDTAQPAAGDQSGKEASHVQ
ncbi:MAG: AzlC family ABC transporter permease [Clostridia bacterium]|nr:AzlC family ABC transporter permease [Clostridia bacterium]